MTLDLHRGICYRTVQKEGGMLIAAQLESDTIYDRAFVVHRRAYFAQNMHLPSRKYGAGPLPCTRDQPFICSQKTPKLYGAQY